MSVRDYDQGEGQEQGQEQEQGNQREHDIEQPFDHGGSTHHFGHGLFHHCDHRVGLRIGKVVVDRQG